MITRIASHLALWRARRRGLAASRRALDELFTSHPGVLAEGRLKPHHRGRATILEYELDASGRATRVLFGIVRHPRSHPLAARGDDVLELLEYRPQDGTLAVVGSGNLTLQRERRRQ